MKRLFSATTTIILTASAAYASGSHYTHSYLRKNGTYVQGHYSGNPDRTVMNNQSFYGNFNNGSTGTNHYKHDLTSPYFNGTTNNAGRYGHQYPAR